MWKAAQSASVWWICRHPWLGLLAATGLLSPILFPSATVSGQVDEAPEPSPAQTLVLSPQRIVITLTSDFELPSSPPSLDRAAKIIGDQIERRREAELEKSSTQ